MNLGGGKGYLNQCCVLCWPQVAFPGPGTHFLLVTCFIYAGRGRLLFSTLPLPLWLSEQHVVQARPYLTPRHMQYTVSLFLVLLLCSPLGLLLPHSCLSLMWGQGPLR